MKSKRASEQQAIARERTSQKSIHGVNDGDKEGQNTGENKEETKIFAPEEISSMILVKMKLVNPHLSL